MEKDNKSFIWVGLGLIILLLLILLVVFIISKTRNKYLTYEKVIEKIPSPKGQNRDRMEAPRRPSPTEKPSGPVRTASAGGRRMPPETD